MCICVPLMHHEQHVLFPMTQHENYSNLCCHSNSVTGADRFMLALQMPLGV